MEGRGAERSLGRVIRAARVIHPFPVALNVAATIGLATIANEGIPAGSTLVRLAGAMFCAQAAIGASNDYCDRDLDAETKPYKPIVQGLLEPRTALLLAGGAALVAGVLAATFGPLSLAVGAIGLAAGLAYNVRLKRSILSPVPFMIALPALPFWVWVSLDRFSSELWWLIPFAPLAGLAVHLSNTLPDIAADRRAGVRGLAHTIGADATRRLAWGSFALALVLAVALGFRLDYDWRPFATGAALAAALLGGAIGAHVVRPGQAAHQIGFGLIGMATAVLATAWLAAIR
ncbi:MAG: UbiA family prenyltransferase [Dehalococcoidia bacterium]